MLSEATIQTAIAALEYRRNAVIASAEWWGEGSQRYSKLLAAASKYDAALAELRQPAAPEAIGELLSCPFCRGNAEVVYRVLAWEPKCLDNTCPGHSSVCYETREMAIAAWNIRPREGG